MHTPQRRNLAKAIRKILILRVSVSDGATLSSESTLSTSVFNSLLRYDTCSEGQLKFQPITDNQLIGSDGAYTVDLPSMSVNNESFRSITFLMINQATSVFGTLTDLVDHVIICLPYGPFSSDTGYHNSWLSITSDDGCTTPSRVIRYIGM